MDLKPRLTIVVPCFNEEETLHDFMAVLQNTQLSMPDVFLECIFVDDGSSDQTLQIIKDLAKQEPNRVQYISFSRNFGKEAAIFAGFANATGDWVALMDADLQDPPNLLPEMLVMIKEGGYDVVATRRINREGEPKLRSFFSYLFYKIINKISDVHLEEGARDYRLMTRQVVKSVLSLPEHNRFSKGIFAWVGFNVAYLEYPNIERSGGISSWTFSGLVKYAVEGIISFSEFPLNIASILGFIIFILSAIYGIYIVVRTLLLGAVTPGWPSLAVLIVGMGGLQLLCLGIIGKYIAKIFIESKRRPMYIIKEQKINHPSQTE